MGQATNKPEFYDRRTDPTPVKCEDCGWQGLAKDAVHTYRGIGIFFTPDGYDEDVEPVDECPECGSENLIPIEMEPANA